MKHLLVSVVAIAALVAGHTTSRAQATDGTFPVNITFQGLMNNGKYAYVINSNLHEPYNSGVLNDVNNLGYVDFDEQVFDVGSSTVPLTMTVDGRLSFPTSTGDATAQGMGTHLTFTSGAKYIMGVEVTTSDGTPVTFDIDKATLFSRELFLDDDITFGKVTLTMATHTPLDYAATITGIASTYINDGVNHPVPTVIYQENSNSTPITLTEGVDYTVSYEVRTITGTLTVTGIGEYTGSKVKTYNIRDFQLSDLNRLDDGSYEIATRQDLDNLSNFVNKGNSCTGVTFRQTADITYDHNTDWNDLTHTEINFHPIGDIYNRFKGHYNGDGKAIRGIRLYGPSNDNAYGLFGCLDGGTVKNVVLADALITTNSCAGAIVGSISYGTVQNCRVENTVTITIKYDIFADDSDLYHGGITGKNTDGSIIGCLCAASVINNTQSKYCGGIAGAVNHGNVKHCLYTGPNASQFISPITGAIAGAAVNSSLFTNNYHTNTGVGGVNYKDKNGARLAHTVTLCDGVALMGEETEYDVSGITAIGTTAIRYNNGTTTTIYSGYGQPLNLSYTGGSVPSGYSMTFTTTAGTIEGDILTMPDGDVEVSALITANTAVVSATPATIFNEAKYVATFYNGLLDYKLPEGSKAYTASLDGTKAVFHLIGDDGNVIPHGNAVIIVSDSASITLTKLASTKVTPYAGNILQGSDTEVSVTNGKVDGETPYVLGLSGDEPGFYKFSGSAIPAGKAYYLKSE